MSKHDELTGPFLDVDIIVGMLLTLMQTHAICDLDKQKLALEDRLVGCAA